MASNTLLTNSVITRRALVVLDNELSFTKQTNRTYDAQFRDSGAKRGTVVNVRKPVRYVPRDGDQMVVQDSTETSVPIVLNHKIGVDMEFSYTDLSRSIDDFSARFIEPAVATIANEIDRLGLQLYKDVYQAVGTAGTVPTTLLTYAQARMKLNQAAAPQDDRRSIVINSHMGVTIVDALKGLFQQSSEIAKQYEKGEMGRAVGFKWFEDENIAVHTYGAQGGTPAVDGANQTGSTLATKDWTSSAANRLQQGDLFTIAGVFAVNPQSRQSTGSLQQFTVLQDADSDSSGDASVSISPAIVTSGAGQTVTVSPADGALITVLGTASQEVPTGLAFHRDAFALACADLMKPRGAGEVSVVSDDQLGLSIRCWSDSEIRSDSQLTRLDVLCGWATLRPELAVRIQSGTN